MAETIKFEFRYFLRPMELQFDGSCISTIIRKRRYECKFDPIECQKPGKFLLEEVCAEVVKEEIKDAKVSHNDDVVNVEIIIHKDKKLCFTLHKQNVPMADSDRISILEEIVDGLYQKLQ